jgi:sugar phosphate isomerase/epimerase
MKKNQVAAILYTLREYCKTEADLAETLKKVRAIGFEAVQVSGVGPIEPARIRELLDEAGLVCCATHESADAIRKSPQDLVAKLQTLGCDITAYPYPAGVEFDSAESVDALISDLDNAGKVFADAGMTLCYHNHAHEFYRTGDTTLYAQILERVPAAHLAAEMDTYWVQAGGCNPIAWINKLSGRLPALHIKDYAVSPEGKPFFAEIGHGNLDFPGIIAAAEKAGCKWFIVEQDVCPGNPFDSLAKSWKYITANLTED